MSIRCRSLGPSERTKSKVTCQDYIRRKASEQVHFFEKGNVPTSVDAHNQVLAKFSAHLVITIQQIREYPIVGKIKKYYRLYIYSWWKYPKQWHACKALLADRMVSLVSSRCSNTQKHNQHVLLKIACIKEVTHFFLQKKIIMLAQIMATTLRRLTCHYHNPELAWVLRIFLRAKTKPSRTV